jgi:hypothetical protein
MTQPGAPQPVPQIRTPEDLSVGTYANGVGVWFSQTEFTIDFVAALPLEPGQDQNGEPVLVAPQQVVARLKLPPPLIFQIMQNLADSMDKYEKQFGAIADHQGQRFGPPSPGVTDDDDS